MGKDAYVKALDAVLAEYPGETRMGALDARLRERFIIIDRADLPKVDLTEEGSLYAGPAGMYRMTASVEKAEKSALGYLRLAEYLREHPPVDEAQVALLADALAEADGDAGLHNLLYDDARKMARLMVQSGARMEPPK